MDTVAAVAEDNHWLGDNRKEADRKHWEDWDCRILGRRVASEVRQQVEADIVREVRTSAAVMLERSEVPADSCPAGDPAAEPSRTWSVAYLRDVMDMPVVDIPAMDSAVHTADILVVLDKVDSEADSPGSVRAVGTGHAAVDNLGSVALAPVAAEHRAVRVGQEPMVPDWVPSVQPKTSVAEPEPHHDNLRPVADSAVGDGLGSWAAALAVGHPVEPAAVAVPVLAGHLRREQPLDLVPVSAPDQRAVMDHLRVPKEDHSVPDRPEERYALEVHCRAEGRAEAEATPECYAEDRPNSPDTPNSGATPHDTTCTRSPCPYSGSPGWSESGRRSRPRSSGCASDWAAEELRLHAASVLRGHRGCPDWAVVGIVAAASKRPTCLFSCFKLSSGKVSKMR